MNKGELDLFRDLLDQHLAAQTDILERMDTRLTGMEKEFGERLKEVEATLNRSRGAVAASLTFLSLFGIIVGAVTRYFSHH